MIKPYSLEAIKEKIDLIPQAILAIDIWDFAKQFNFNVEKGEDNLDYYVGVGAFSEEGYPFAVMHYRGYPDHTSTIYLPRGFAKNDVAKISDAVNSIAREFKISEKQIIWQRRDDPSL